MCVTSVQVGELPSIGGLEIAEYKACTVTQEERAESLQGGSRGFETLSAHPLSKSQRLPRSEATSRVRSIKHLRLLFQTLRTTGRHPRADVTL